MLKIETNLKLSDYQRLLFYNYASKNITTIEKEHTKRCREKPKEKEIELKIDNNIYNGKIISYPIVFNITPQDYRHIKWEFDTEAVFKINFELSMNNKKLIEELINEEIIYVDGKKYYMGGEPKIKNNIINFTFIAFDDVKSSNIILI